MVGMLARPRLPAVTPTRIPGSIRPSNAVSWQSDRRINVPDVGRVEVLPDAVHRGQWRFNVQVRDMIEQGRCCHRCSSRLLARGRIHVFAYSRRFCATIAEYEGGAFAGGKRAVWMLALGYYPGQCCRR